MFKLLPFILNTLYHISAICEHFKELLFYPTLALFNHPPCTYNIFDNQTYIYLCFLRPFWQNYIMILHEFLFA